MAAVFGRVCNILSFDGEVMSGDVMIEMFVVNEL